MQKLEKLKRKDLADFRRRLLEAQGGVCPICNNKIKKGEDVLDHDHDTGHIRAVLHRHCNQIEGRVKRWCKNNGQDASFRTILRNIQLYWDESYEGNLIHPNHKTEKEKEISRLKKKIGKLKTESAKKKYEDKIKRLLEDG